MIPQVLGECANSLFRSNLA